LEPNRRRRPFRRFGNDVTSDTNPSGYPGFIEACDDVESATQFRIQNGMPETYLLFHMGTWLSAFRLADQMFVTLDDKSRTFDEWYARRLRRIYAEEFGLR
jgi:hypothetical protein